MSIRVLLVEDNKLDIMAFERMVRSENLPYHYTVAKRVSEALDYLSQQTFDIVVVDYKLPETSGFDVLKAEKIAPVIFMTAYGDETVAVEAMKLGASDYIVKDNNYTYVTLLPITIERVLEQDRLKKRLRNIEFEHNLAGMLHFSMTGEVIDCNETSIHLFGFRDKSQILHTNWSALISDDFHAISHELYTEELLLSRNLTLHHTDGYERFAVANIAFIPPTHQQDGSIRAVLIDITTQKIVENELYILKQAIDCSTVGITLADARQPDMPITYLNPAFETLTGYTIDDVFGENCRFLQRNDREQPGLGQLRNALRKGESASVILRNYRKDGTLFWNHLTTSPVYNKLGELTHFVGIQKDITELKQMEEAVQISEKRYRQMFELHGLPKLLIDSETGKIVDANPASGYFYGIAVSDLKALTIFDLTVSSHDDVKAKLMEATKTAMLSCEFIHRGSKNSLRNVEVFSGTIEIEGKQLLYSIVTDITEKQRAKIALQESYALLEQRVLERTSDLEQAKNYLESASQRLKLATKAGGIGVWEWDLDDDSLTWDERMFALYGLSQDDLMPTSQIWERTVHPADLPMLKAERLAAIYENKEYDIDFRVIWPDMTIHTIKSNAFVIREVDGKAQRMVGVNMDITKHKEAEQALHDALEKERELSELKSRFVSMASHEFRTPLATILAITEALIASLGKIDPTQIDARLNRIRQQVRHMKAIMEDVLQLTRIQSGHIDFCPVSSDLNKLCNEIVDEFEIQPQYKGRIVYRCANAPLHIESDSRLMRQVVSNLISNALKYSEESKAIYVDLTQNLTDVVLQVCDEGIGIPPDDLKHLFEPFHRAKNVGAISGTGLGLSISQQAVELHGGTIIAESEVGVGTILRVIIPKATDKAAE